MRTTILFLTIALLYVPGIAQEQTLLGTTDIENGGYAAPVAKFTTVNNEFGLLVGGRGGWIINHTFSIGLAGYGLANNINARTIGPYGQKYLRLGYGGLDLEYVANSNDLLHFSVHSLIGGGTAGFRYGWNEDRWNYEYGEHDRNYNLFFIFEPGANVDLNVIPWFRTSVGISYRFVAGLSSSAASNSDISGLSAGLTFRFGKF